MLCKHKCTRLAPTHPEPQKNQTPTKTANPRLPTHHPRRKTRNARTWVVAEVAEDEDDEEGRAALDDLPPHLPAAPHPQSRSRHASPTGTTVDRPGGDHATFGRRSRDRVT